MKNLDGLYFCAIVISIVILAFLGLSINIKTTKANESIPKLQKKLRLIREKNQKLEQGLLEKKTLYQLDKHAQTLGLKPIKYKTHVSEPVTP